MRGGRAGGEGGADSILLCALSCEILSPGFAWGLLELLVSTVSGVSPRAQVGSRVGMRTSLLVTVFPFLWRVGSSGFTAFVALPVLWFYRCWWFYRFFWFYRL